MVKSSFKNRTIEINFDEFCNLIAKLCQKIFSNYDEKPRENIINFVTQFLLNNLRKNNMHSEMNDKILSAEKSLNKNPENSKIKDYTRQKNEGKFF